MSFSFFSPTGSKTKCLKNVLNGEKCALKVAYKNDKKKVLYVKQVLLTSFTIKCCMQFLTIMQISFDGKMTNP